MAYVSFFELLFQWIVSAECSTSDCDGVQKYYEAQSQTLSMSKKAFKLSYLMGSVIGNIGFETVDVGPFSISSQVFGTPLLTRSTFPAI